MDLDIISVQQHFLRQSIAQALNRSFRRRVRRVSGNGIQTSYGAREYQMSRIPFADGPRREPFIQYRVCHVIAGEEVDFHLPAHNFRRCLDEKARDSSTCDAPYDIRRLPFVPCNCFRNDSRISIRSGEIGRDVLKSLI
jgi:hypothetical protein